MTYRQAKIILTFAENNMRVRDTAWQLYRSEGSVTYQFKKIHEETGLNPRKFFDLVSLVEMARRIYGNRGGQKMATKHLISVLDCPCDGCQAKPCGHPAKCVKFTIWLNKTVDAVEVVHGHWTSTTEPDEQFGEMDYFKCSVCGKLRWFETNYCPNCGAKMKGE